MSGLVEYRVVWKREGKHRRSIVVAKRETAERLASVRRGESVDDRDDYRDFAPLEYCFVEERTIGEWHAPFGCPKCGEEP